MENIKRIGEGLRNGLYTTNPHASAADLAFAGFGFVALHRGADLGSITGHGGHFIDSGLRGFAHCECPPVDTKRPPQGDLPGVCVRRGSLCGGLLADAKVRPPRGRREKPSHHWTSQVDVRSYVLPGE